MIVTLTANPSFDRTISSPAGWTVVASSAPTPSSSRRAARA